jgi:DNA-directed RNA polymerase subunit L
VVYEVEADFEHNRLRCVVVMQDGGWRCGYVGVPKGNIFYGKNYHDHISELESLQEKLKNTPVGKRSPLSIVFWNGESVSPEVLFNVHGGITFADSIENYPVESELWWFGYDCNHCGDAVDVDRIKNVKHRQVTIEINEKYPIRDQIVRSLEYCIDECKSLADQIVEITSFIGG